MNAKALRLFEHLRKTPARPANSFKPTGRDWFLADFFVDEPENFYQRLVATINNQGLYCYQDKWAAQLGSDSVSAVVVALHNFHHGTNLPPNYYNLVRHKTPDAEVVRQLDALDLRLITWSEAALLSNLDEPHCWAEHFLYQDFPELSLLGGRKGSIGYHWIYGTRKAKSSRTTGEFVHSRQAKFIVCEGLAYAITETLAVEALPHEMVVANMPDVVLGCWDVAEKSHYLLYGDVWGDYRDTTSFVAPVFER